MEAPTPPGDARTSDPAPHPRSSASPPSALLREPRPILARPFAVAALVFLAVVVVLFVVAPKGTSIDFAVFYKAGRRFLDGASLYPPDDGHFAFKYAPIGALFFAPLALFSQPVGWLLMNLASTAALLRVLRFTARRLGRGQVSWKEQAVWLGVVAPFFGHLFWLGQSDGLVLWLAVESEDLAERRPVWSGAVWALACLVKPPFLTLLLVAAIFREGRRLLGLALGAAAWLALGLVRHGLSGGVEELLAWRRTLSASTPELLCNMFNQSAFALTCTYLADSKSPAFLPSLAALAAVTVAGLGALAFAAWRRSPALGRLGLFGLALYLAAFLSPLGWNTNLLTLFPLAGALAAAAVGAEDLRVRRAALGAAIAVVVLNTLDLILLPFHLWPETADVLLEARQYGVAGLLLAGAGLAALVAASRASSAARA